MIAARGLLPPTGRPLGRTGWANAEDDDEEDEAPVS